MLQLGITRGAVSTKRQVATSSRAGLTQAKLAEQVGISASFLGHIERGSRVASLDTLVQLCHALHVTPNELLGEETGYLCAALPERMTVSVPELLQGVADLLRNQKIRSD